jgi:hypothetical protein
MQDITFDRKAKKVISEEESRIKLNERLSELIRRVKKR